MNQPSKIDPASDEAKSRPRFASINLGPLKKKTEVIEITATSGNVNKYRQNAYHYDCLDHGKRVIVTRYLNGRVSLISVIGSGRHSRNARQIAELWLTSTSTTEFEIDEQVEKVARTSFPEIGWKNA